MKTLLGPSTAAWLLRLALAASFLSAVADRLGFWGAPSGKGVAWGAWQPFVDYTGVLLFYLPQSLVSVSAVLATVAEVVLALWLLIGWRLRIAAYASAALLLSFAVSMALAFGVKAPLDYSVLTASVAAYALGCLGRES